MVNKTRRYLFSLENALVGNNDDFFVLLDRNSLGHTVGITAVVDVPGQTARYRRIHHTFVVQPKHVDSSILKKKILRLVEVDAMVYYKYEILTHLLFVELLASVGYFVSNQLADVLDYHRVLFQVSGSIQAQSLLINLMKHKNRENQTNYASKQ